MCVGLTAVFSLAVTAGVSLVSWTQVSLVPTKLLSQGALPMGEK